MLICGGLKKQFFDHAKLLTGLQDLSATSLVLLEVKGWAGCIAVVLLCDITGEHAYNIIHHSAYRQWMSCPDDGEHQV